MKKIGKSALGKGRKPGLAVSVLPDKAIRYTARGAFADLEEMAGFVTKAKEKQKGTPLEFLTDILPDQTAVGLVRGAYKDVEELADYFTAETKSITKETKEVTREMGEGLESLTQLEKDTE